MQVLLQFREFSSLYFWYPNQCLVHIRLLKINLLNKTKLKETNFIGHKYGCVCQNRLDYAAGRNTVKPRLLT